MISFYEKSFIDIDEMSVTVTASSNDIYSFKLRDRRKTTFWLSSNSNDLTTETLICDFGSIKSLDFIGFVLFNFKNFRIYYDVLGTWTLLETITNNAIETIFKAYPTFITQKIKIEIDTTFVTNEQKKLTELIISQKLGTLEGTPDLKVTLDKNKVIKNLLRGKIKVIDNDEVIDLTFDFETYPNQNDTQLIQSLIDRFNPFYITLTDGQENLFTYKLKGFLDSDIRLYTVVSKFTPEYWKNVFTLAPSFSVSFSEV